MFDQNLDYVEDDPHGTSARVKNVTIRFRRCRRRPGVADGRRRQADAHDSRPHHSGASHRRADAAMRRAHPQCQWRSRAFPCSDCQADGVADFPGPFAGILAALDWAAANRPTCRSC